MARLGSKIKAISQPGSLKDGQGLESVGAYRKSIVIELSGAEMAAMADEDVIYQFPCDAWVESTLVKNIGTTAVAVATSLYLDDGGNTNISANLGTLAAGASAGLAASADFTAGETVELEIAGTDTTANTCSLRVIINAVFSEDVDW